MVLMVFFFISSIAPSTSTVLVAAYRSPLSTAVVTSAMC